MTGYGRGSAAEGALGLSVELRSVNNRFLDVQVRLPRSLAPLETRIRKAVQERFARGRIDVFVNRSGHDGGPSRLVLDEALTAQYLGILKELQERFGIGGEVGLAQFLSVPDIIRREEVEESADAVWGVLEEAINAAAAALRSMREEEGSALARDIAARLESLKAMAAGVEERSPVVVELARKRMADALQKVLQEQPDPARIAQEIAMLAERTDVTEELTRLASHVAQFRTFLEGPGDEPLGRKLDFLIQEMGREVNTIASKAQDAEVSQQAVQMKAELEKVREQVQNIE